MSAATSRFFEINTGPEKLRLELHPSEVLRMWGRILSGHKPLLSIEITRECPLRCPGCYAYEPQHLGGSVTLRQLSDYKGDELVRRVLDLVDILRPIHVSIVGGDPLVRFRELQEILPALSGRRIGVFLITSAFRKIPPEWFSLPGLDIIVSIDGLPAEHDVRRKPATYDRILQSVAGNPISIHCTVTSAMVRPGYLEEFLVFWSNRPETRRIWMSLFTPQRGATNVEILGPDDRGFVIEELVRLAPRYPKLDVNREILREFQHPPSQPADCVFARLTESVSADLKTRITPCQFGGDPDCSQCGCFPSMLLNSGGHKVIAGLRAASILKASAALGTLVAHQRGAR
ncbi:MAG TPA: radical SAM protein [Terriglobales bacterium]|nr:radical SAM protein [Terriglobales bacterium]